MKRVTAIPRRAACAALVLAAVFACVSYPEGYVAPDKIVFLRQPLSLTPIRYETESADPYAWEIAVEVDRDNPIILTALDFRAFLKPDIRLDAITYRETKEHLLWVKDNPVYNELRSRLNGTAVEAPVPRPFAKGEVINNFANGTEYAYPAEEGATILVFLNRDVRITFADGRQYLWKNNGDFFEKDAQGGELYAFFAENGSFRRRIGNDLYSQAPDQRSLKTESGEIWKTVVPQPQYAFTPSGKRYRYVFFVDDFISEKLVNLALIHDGLRFDYLPGTETVLVVYQEKEGIVIEPGNKKSHRFFNAQTRKPEDLYSYYFPEGIRIAEVHRPLTWSEVTPNWPERYRERNVGPCRIFYVEKDEALLARLDAKKLGEAFAAVSKTTGIAFSANCVVVFPPGLESYRKLHAREKKEKLLWYPSGFQGKGIVVMWPPSVPRYEGELGEAYFWKTEFYEILVHELTHLAVGEVTGVFSPVPVWLNEGLAVYTESRYSDAAKKYWDVTFRVCRDELLDWDVIAVSGTSDFAVNSARTHYAQSYKMVEYLAGAFGVRRLAAYLVSFKLPFDKIPSADLKSSYKENFKTIFKVSWEDNLAAFAEYLKKLKP